MLSFLSKLFRRQPFAGLDLDEKRELLAFDRAALKKERSRRDEGGSTAKGSLLKRVSDTELETLLQIRKLMDKAAAKRGLEAISLYKKVPKLAPWDDRCWLKMAEIADSMGRRDSAKRWLQIAQDLNPDGDQVREAFEKVERDEQQGRDAKRQKRELAIRAWTGNKQFALISVHLGRQVQAAKEELDRMLARYPLQCDYTLAGAGSFVTIMAPWENHAPCFDRAIVSAAVVMILKAYGDDVTQLGLVGHENTGQWSTLADEWRKFSAGI